LRVPDDQTWLELNDAEGPTSAKYELRLKDRSTLAADYDFDVTYSVSITPDFIYGDLGAFWHTEWAFDAAQGNISIGPVASTDSWLPNQVNMRAENGSIVEVLATGSDGRYYAFDAKPFQ
jgi:hypothetical protein